MELTAAAPAGAPAPAPTSVGTGVLLLFAEAARERRRVVFAYRSGAGRESARTVRPYGLVAHRGRWLVVGDDSDSGEVRTFRLDRVELQAESLAWVPGVLAALGRPFVVDGPDELRDGLRELARRLVAAAE